ncbi:amino acid/polyamine/organocation transporter (APC superfamily) [Amycolatopsis cihanbeyliensis]|uniref:Amino acid/polyamine/organocation transporter (APC superfamily) n=2 Tax=Amycolatopsis cihanbeyliensis TaxID=1128664 RepID=A0A542DNP3_AMYCI|nr:amino acid/polyamine/organocation transporter (APC superfamily) [Amycolatopsis cihanbeyliensis]
MAMNASEKSIDATNTGQPKQLRRGLKVLGTVLITLSAITPASSVFIIAPGVLEQAGTGALWSFLAAGVVGIFMAFVYAELASAYPLSGGEYAIVGRTLGRLPGFLILGLFLITQLLILAVIALGVGTYLGVLLPGLNGQVTAAVVVIASAVLAVFDVKFNAVVTGIFLAVEMAALVVLSLLGFLNVERPIGEVLLEPTVLSGQSDLAPTSVGLIAAAVAVAIFAYNGYGSAVYFGEETADANRGIARAILWALGITVIAELLPVTAMVLGTPDLAATFGAENMMNHFVIERGGSTLNTVISLAVALAIINAVIAITLLSARLLFSTGRDRVWSRSINRGMASIHPRFGTPWVATLVTGVVGAAICFVDETLLLVLTGTGLVVVYGSLCVAVLAGRRNGSTAHAAYKMPLFPLPPLIGLGALVYVVYQNALDPKIGRPSLIVTGVVLLIALAYYVFVLRRRGTWELRGPEEDNSTTVDTPATTEPEKP